MQPEGKGQHLVVLVIIAIATFLLPIVQRWLRLRAERAGALRRQTEGRQEDFDPFQDLRPDESETLESLQQASAEEAVLDEEEPVKQAPPAAVPADVKPLLQPSLPIPGRPGDSLERRLFANRRWNAGAKLMIARELIDRPKCFRRGL